MRCFRSAGEQLQASAIFPSYCSRLKVDMISDRAGRWLPGHGRHNCADCVVMSFPSVAESGDRKGGDETEGGTYRRKRS